MGVGVFLFFWIVGGGGIGAAIGSSKGRAGEGFALGLLLGFIGWIIVAVMPPSTAVQARQAALVAAAVGQGREETAGPSKACPWCAERIKLAARGVPVLWARRRRPRRGGVPA